MMMEQNALIQLQLKSVERSRKKGNVTKENGRKNAYLPVVSVSSVEYYLK